jgi:hypothetical protein
MPIEFNVYRLSDSLGNLTALETKRDWMDDTPEKHAYRCFPLGLVNNLGWGISFPKDITFICNSNPKPQQKYIEVISGEEYLYIDSRNDIITFNTGLMFKTDENLTLWVKRVPNQFIDGVHVLEVLLNASFLKGQLSPAWKISKKDVPITIKAGTPVVSVLPIDLAQINHSTAIISNGLDLPLDEVQNDPEYTEYVTRRQKDGDWAGLYKNAVDHKGNSLGSHQAKKIILNVRDISK